MTFDKKEMIEKLKLELEILEKGGYAPSVREPRWMPRVFRDSVSCPNVGLEIKVEPCSHCFLMERPLSSESCFSPAPCLAP